VVGVQFAAVFQSLLIGFRFQVALPAWGNRVSEYQKSSAEKQSADGEAGLIHRWSVALGCQGLGAAVAGSAFLRSLHPL
jgi:hypothetical protein